MTSYIITLPAHHREHNDSQYPRPLPTIEKHHRCSEVTCDRSQILAGLTSSLTVHVVPEVDSQRREEGDEVDDEEPLFPAVGLAILEDGLSDHSAACWVYVGGLPS